MTKTIAALFNEPPIIKPLTKSLLVTFGWERAVFIQQVHYWTCNSDSRKVKEFPDDKGIMRCWVNKTYLQWKEELFYSSERTVRRMIKCLEDEGLLLSKEGESRIKHYTLDYEKLAFYLNGKQEIDECPERTSESMARMDNDMSVQNGQSECPKWTDMSVQNGQSVYIEERNLERNSKERVAHSRNAPPSVSDFSDKKEGKSSSSKGTRLPHDWELPNEWREWLLSHGVFNEQIDLEAEKFKCYWGAKSGSSATKVNWFMTWKNWCYSTMERSGKNIKILTPKPISPPQEKSRQSPVSIIPKSNDPKIQRWYELQADLRNAMGDSNYDSWIVGNLELINVGDKATFRVKSAFYRDWIQQHYGSVLATILAKINPFLQDRTRIEFVIEDLN